MKWLTHAHLINYKCHIDKRVDFDRGTNVLIGKSGQGKSTFMSGIVKCLVNKPDRATDSFLPWGAKRGTKTIIRVGVKDDNDGFYTESEAPETIIERVLGKGINEYNIYYPGSETPVPYSGFGKTVPPEVLAVHGMREVDLGYAKENLNHMGQFDSFFLTSRKPEEVAVALGRLAHTELIEEIRDSLRSDISVTKTAVTRENAEIEKLTVRLTAFEYLDDEKVLIDEAEISFATGQRIAALLSYVEKILNRTTVLSGELANFEALRSDKTDYPTAIRYLDSALTVHENMRSVARSESMVDLSAITIAKAQSIIDRCPDIEAFHAKIAETERAMDIYSKVRTLAFSIAKTAESIREYDEKAASGFDKALFDAEIHKAIEAGEAYQGVFKISGDVLSLTAALSTYCSKLETAEKSFNEAKEKLSEFMKGSCPVCGQSLENADMDTLSLHVR